MDSTVIIVLGIILLALIILNNITTIEKNINVENVSDPIRLKSSTSNFEIYQLKFEKKQRSNIFIQENARLDLVHYSSFYLNVWVKCL